MVHRIDHTMWVMSNKINAPTTVTDAGSQLTATITICLKNFRKKKMSYQIRVSKICFHKLDFQKQRSHQTFNSIFSRSIDTPQISGQLDNQIKVESWIEHVKNMVKFYMFNRPIMKYNSIQMRFCTQEKLFM